jgi:uncharacterized protein YxjI
LKLLIKQKVFSWGDKYDIYDEDGNAKYFVEAELFRIGHVVHIYDKNQKEVGCIRQKLLTFMPKFELEIYGMTIGYLKKKFTFFRPRYELDYENWLVEGNVFAWDYDIVEGSKVIMHINKKLFTFGDTYELNIHDAKNEIICLLIAIGIDAANCGN